jgi:hypothetical protein
MYICTYYIKMLLHYVKNYMANTQVCKVEGDTYTGRQINTDVGNNVIHLLENIKT